MEENPYSPPQDTQESRPTGPEADVVPGELLWMLGLTVLVGSAAGLFLGPSFGNGDPSVTMGLGGGVGLLLHFALRWLRKRRG